MKKYSFYWFIAGQILFVFLVEMLFFYNLVVLTFIEHLVLGLATFLITSLSYYISKKMITKDPLYFIQTIIASTSVKLILYIALIAFLLFFFTGPPVGYIFFFFISYLLVTTTEIISLVRTLREQRNKTV